VPGSKAGLITIERPEGPSRPPNNVTFQGDDHHPKPGDKIVVQRRPFATEWDPVPAGANKLNYLSVSTHLVHYRVEINILSSIRVPHLLEPHSQTDDTHILKLGFALGLEKIHPPFVCPLRFNFECMTNFLKLILILA
jgi:hypothetical protein